MKIEELNRIEKIIFFFFNMCKMVEISAETYADANVHAINN